MVSPPSTNDNNSGGPGQGNGTNNGMAGNGGGRGGGASGMMGSFGMGMHGGHAPFGALGGGSGGLGVGGGVNDGTMRGHPVGSLNSNSSASLQMVAPWMMPPVHHRPTLAGSNTTGGGTAAGTADDSSASNSSGGSSGNGSSSNDSRGYSANGSSNYENEELRRMFPESSRGSVLSATPSAPVVSLDGSNSYGGYSHGRSGSSTPPMELHNKNIEHNNNVNSNSSASGSGAYSGPYAPISNGSLSSAPVAAAATPAGRTEEVSSHPQFQQHSEGELLLPPAAHPSAHLSVQNHNPSAQTAATPSGSAAAHATTPSGHRNGNGDNTDHHRRITTHSQQQQPPGPEVLEVPLRGGQDDAGSQKLYGSGSRNSSVEDFLSLVQSGDIPAPERSMLSESIFPGSNNRANSSSQNGSAQSGAHHNSSSTSSATASSTSTTATEKILIKVHFAQKPHT